MRGKKLAAFAGTALFFALLFVALALASRVLERKASVAKMQGLLDAPEAIDVLFVGDSHMVNAVFPMELWHDYGIAGYNVASYGNTLPMSYWSLMNVFERATPKLVVVGVKDVNKKYTKVSASSGEVHTTFDCFPLSLTKIRAIEDLMDDPDAVDDEGNRYVDIKWEYYFTLGKYHSRWSELTRGDFFPEPDGQKGAAMAIGVAKPNDYDIIDERQAMEEDGLGFAYLRRIIEACQERGVDVLLVHLPYPSTEADQEAANAVWYVADEYGVEYVDFVGLDQVVDYGTDCYDSFSHLNPSGARKVTDYLGRYIVEHYGIEDRRGDARYGSWDGDYAAYTRYKLELIAAQKDVRTALMLLHDTGMSALVSVAAGSSLYRDGTLLRLMQNIAREHIYEEDAFAKWSDALMPLDRLDEAASSGEAYLLLVDRLGADAPGRVVEMVGEAEETIGASFGEVRYRCGADGAALSLGGEALFAASDADVRIALIDSATGEVAAVLEYDW